MSVAAGRKSKYDTHIKPYMDQIAEWYQDHTEEQIADMLGIAVSTWNMYKRDHPELVQILQDAKKKLITDLKASLKKKAKGFHYEESKHVIKDENGKITDTTEVYKKYAQPDTAAIHLLLKNLDPEWVNDDQSTLELKKKQIELQEKRIEASEWS
jgi:hypothetical protein